MNRILMTLGGCLILITSGAAAVEPAKDQPDPYANESKEQRDARLKWFREARFGMFIHWGVYSVPAGIYHGKHIDSIGEWIMFNAKIPCAEYQSFARVFDPVKYDAEEWVKLAKEAGMRYIVITAKHHDGFAMFDSKASEWNIMKASPFNRDPLKELAAACKKHGIRLGFYYSQAQDWNNPGGGVCGTHWDPAQNGSMDDYIRRVAVPQVRELLSNYGPISVLWWDTACEMNKERADQLIALLKLQPGIIHNNRMGGGYSGDTETPEQFIPPTGYPGRDWETCMTLNDTWGYKSYDTNWKSAETIIRNLVDIASKGGNYLLNVGPTSEGAIPSPSVDRLKAVGAWMKINHEAIYETAASPFRRLPWGRCTKKLRTDGATLYLHVFKWPADGQLMVPGLKNEVVNAAVLGQRQKLKTLQEVDGVRITVPREQPEPISTTLVLKIKGVPVVDEAPIGQNADGSLRLTATEAITHGTHIQYEGGDQRDCIGFWTETQDWIEWPIKMTKAGKYLVTAEIAALGSGTFELSIADQKLRAKAPTTGDYGKFEQAQLGTLELTATGKVSVAVKALAEGWSPLNLKWVKFTPVH